MLTKMEEILLLAIWRLEGEAYGVKIRRHVSRLTGRDFTYGNLYSALHQLNKKRYVVKTSGEPVPERRGRSRIYYRVSPAGLAALKAARELNEKLWAGIPEYAFG